MDLHPNMATALEAFLRGNLQKAELLCRRTLMESEQHPAAWLLLARMAELVGDGPLGRQYLQRAREVSPGMEAHEVPPVPVVTAKPHPRYLLIKAWGFGFWSDMDHVYGSLLLAELTGRIPMVHWGRNSLFRDADTDNAFESFFEPVSGLGWSEVQAPGLSCFPLKWHAGNLREPETGKWAGEGSRLTGPYLLHRTENVVVSDYHIKINDLMPWIPPQHPLHGLERAALYRHLHEKYLRLKPHLKARVDDIWQSRMADRHWLAVHVRGTDKVFEIHNLDAVNQAYERRIAQILQVNPALNLFLMTDSHDVLTQYRQRWGDRILSMECQRGSGTTGVHLEGHPGTLMGEQVIVDAWLASRCDYFLGNGGSNVSSAIRHLKHWSPGTFFLIGQDFLGSIDLSLHEW